MALHPVARCTNTGFSADLAWIGMSGEATKPRCPDSFICMVSNEYYLPGVFSKKTTYFVSTFKACSLAPHLVSERCFRSVAERPQSLEGMLAMYKRVTILANLDRQGKHRRDCDFDCGLSNDLSCTQAPAEGHAA